MTQEELVERVVVASRREKSARDAEVNAREESREAVAALQEAWSKLRDFQEGLVAEALSR